MKTLVIASISAVTAALVTSFFWRKGTLVSTALTPIIVTLTQEALRKAPEKIGATASRASVAPTRGAGAIAAAAGGRAAASRTPTAATRRAPLAAPAPPAGRFDERALLEKERGLRGEDGARDQGGPPEAFGAAARRSGAGGAGAGGGAKATGHERGRNGAAASDGNGTHPAGAEPSVGRPDGFVAPPPPADDVRSYDPARSAGTAPATGDTAPAAAAAGTAPERRVYGRRRFRWKAALITGLAAFAIAAVALTASELALGGSVGGDGRTSLFGGGGGAERLGGDDSSSEGSSDSSDDGSDGSGSSSSQSIPDDSESAPAPEESAPSEEAPTEEPVEPAPVEPAPVQPAPTQ